MITEYCSLDKLGVTVLKLHWNHMEGPIRFQVLLKVREWMKEYSISDLYLNYGDGSAYWPSGIMLDEEDAVAFLFTFGYFCENKNNN